MGERPTPARLVEDDWMSDPPHEIKKHGYWYRRSIPEAGWREVWALDDGDGVYWTCEDREDAYEAWDRVNELSEKGEPVEPAQVVGVVRIRIPDSTEGET